MRRFGWPRATRRRGSSGPAAFLLASERERSGEHHRPDPGCRSDRLLGPQSPDPVCSPANSACPGGQIFTGPLDHVVDKQLAVFGEVALKFTDTFKATAGLRVSRLDYAARSSQRDRFSARPSSRQSSATEKPVTPKAVLSWQPDHDTLLYASASKGFRPGGPNVGVGSICESILSRSGRHKCRHSFPRTACGATRSAARTPSWTIACRLTPACFTSTGATFSRTFTSFLRRAVHGQSRQGEERGRRNRDPLQAGGSADPRFDRRLYRCTVDQDLLRRAP